MMSSGDDHVPPAAAPIEPPDSDPPDSVDDGDPVAEAAEERQLDVTTADHGQRLDRWLADRVGEFSRSHLQQLIVDGHVAVDGRAQTTPARRVAAGQRVRVTLVPTDESRAFRPEPMTLPIVHEDEHLIVIDKPAGWVVHPAPGHWSGTLMNGLLAHHAGATHLPRAGIVHRLDMDTSGLMVVGKTLPAVTALVRAIAAREVGRRYLALAWGDVGAGTRSIEAPVGRDPKSRTRMAVVATGKPARTDVERLSTVDGISAVRCTLHTGRTHQIRVHLASRGHPLVADRLYGGAAALGMTRQALHAHELRFVHPIAGTALSFVAPPPPDFAVAWQAIHAET